jgi:hypothetical protein
MIDTQFLLPAQRAAAAVAASTAPIATPTSAFSGTVDSA